MNDDGEPSGTAGKQIYGQILSYGLTNILIVVVRYFGGTLLGTSGLINAYRNAAKDCLEKASTIDEVLMKKLSLRFTYDQMNSVLRLLKEESAIIDKQNFEADCIIESGFGN
jgi:putative IMPACT (imprinted ancient) family translation regulator